MLTRFTGQIYLLAADEVLVQSILEPWLSQEQEVLLELEVLNKVPLLQAVRGEENQVQGLDPRLVPRLLREPVAPQVVEVWINVNIL